MRIPFPERVPLDRVGLFAVVLFLVQTAEGTAFYFAVGTFAFIIIAALSFNIAGGLSRTAGTYIFFYSTLVFIVGVCYKAFLGEPGESNLRDPHTTIMVYDAGIFVMGIAAILSKTMTPKVALLRNVVKDGDMYRAAVGCFAFGIFGSALISMLGNTEFAARVASAFSQLNQLIPLAIIMATMFAIRTSGGRGSTNTAVLFGLGYYFLFYGLLSFSKQGMFQPFLCWLLPIAALRFSLSKTQVAAILGGVFIAFYYLVPYSQYGRVLMPENPTFGKVLSVSADLLLHPNDTRAAFRKTETDSADVLMLTRYYNNGEGFFDRLQFIGIDDAIIEVTDQGHEYGLAPIGAAFLNVVPRFIWKDKPTQLVQTLYAHELGILAEDDLTTGVSFSPTGEAYHLAGWLGVLVIAPAIWLLLFVIGDALYGDLRTTPWGLLAVALISHIAPEAGITGAVYFLTFGSVILCFCAFFSGYVAPVLAVAFLGVDRRNKKPQILRPAIGPRAIQ